MGKNARDRLKSKQKKLDKRRQRETTRKNPENALQKNAIENCVAATKLLLGGVGEVPASERGHMREVAAFAGPGWLQLMTHVEAFLYQGKPWSMPETQIAGFRGAFHRHDGDFAFQRLMMLAKTLTPDRVSSPPRQNFDAPTHPGISPHLPPEMDDDVPMAWGQIFWDLDHTQCPKGKALSTYLSGLRDAMVYTCSRPLGSALIQSIKSVLKTHKAGQRQTTSPPKPDTTWDLCEKVLSQFGLSEPEAAWLQTYKLFLRRHLLAPHVTIDGQPLSPSTLHSTPHLSAALFPHPLPQLRQKRLEGQDPLETVSISANAKELLGYLETNGRTTQLSYADRLRLELILLKIAIDIARRHAPGTAGDTRPAVSERWGRIYDFVTTGVPPSERPLAALVEPVLTDYYTEQCRTLALFKANLDLTLRLLRRTPDDFRLACLAATGASLLRDTKRWPPVCTSGYRHVNPEFFLNTAFFLSDHSDAFADRLRKDLLTPLPKENQKACLLRLFKDSIRMTRNPVDLLECLANLWPYLKAAPLIVQDIAQGHAVDHEILFYGILIGAVRDHPWPCLTLDQTQQLFVTAVDVIKTNRNFEDLINEFLMKHTSVWLGSGPDALVRWKLVMGTLSERMTLSLTSQLSATLAKVPEPAKISEEYAWLKGIEQQNMRKIAATPPKKSKQRRRFADDFLPF